MIQPKTDNHGELIVSSLGELDDSSLENWVRSQIRGENLYITGDVHSGERPYYLLDHTFEELDADTRQRMRLILLKFLRQIKVDGEDWNDEAATGLFLLVETYFAENCYREEVISLLEELYKRYVDENKFDLQQRTLQGLLGLEYRASDPEFWPNVAKSSNDLFGIALHGLFLRDWREALEFLPSMPDSEIVFSQVVSTLNFMLDRFPELQAEQLWRATEKGGESVKRVVEHVLELRGVKMSSSFGKVWQKSLDALQEIRQFMETAKKDDFKELLKEVKDAGFSKEELALGNFIASCSAKRKEMDNIRRRIETYNKIDDFSVQREFGTFKIYDSRSMVDISTVTSTKAMN